MTLDLIAYLDSARRCSNPSCSGVYFTHRVRFVDFVDFCGKYRVPLLKYLCSPHPTLTEQPASDDKLKKLVLLSNFEDVFDFQ